MRTYTSPCIGISPHLYRCQFNAVAWLHRIADRWRDCVVVCSCGWRTAHRTMKAAETEWREHRKRCAP